jgi:quercetin dioxygenase-like cupin family protein
MRADLIIQGKVQIWVGEQQYILGPGDSIYQKSNIPHRSRNIGDEDVIVVTAITPPSF